MRLRHIILCSTLLALSACVSSLPFIGDPLDDVERLSDVELPQEADAVSLVAVDPPSDAPQGFFARMMGRVTSNVDPVPSQDADPEPTTENLAEVIADDDVVDVVAPDEALTEEAATAGPAPESTGIFGFLRRVGGTAASPDQDSAAAPEPVVEADPDLIAPMTQQAFGEVGKTCGLSPRNLGTEIANVSGYRVYDTIPNSTAPRPHYITGFDDRCARQFTAALVLTGDVGTHEIVRYQGSGRNLPYTETDLAYEQIKAQFCGAGHGAPCGARIDALSRHTTFITAYESFASSPVWAEILVSGGDLVSVSVESR